MNININKYTVFKYGFNIFFVRYKHLTKLISDAILLVTKNRHNCLTDQIMVTDMNTNGKHTADLYINSNYHT